MKSFLSALSKVGPPNWYVVLFGATLLIVLDHVNDRCFSSIALDSWVQLIYVPAGYKLIIVLLFGASGALAVFLGSIINFIDNFSFLRLGDVVTMAALYAAAPLATRIIFERMTGKGYPWMDLRFVDILILTLTSAVLSYSAVAVVLGGYREFALTLRHMKYFIIGDLLGTALTLLILFFTLRLIDRSRAR
jgi:hypothetical protein